MSFASEVLLDGAFINNMRTAGRIKRGIATVPEIRRLFPRLTVLENLEMGAQTRTDKEGVKTDLEEVYRLFPPACASAGIIALTGAALEPGPRTREGVSADSEPPTLLRPGDQLALELGERAQHHVDQQIG